MKIDQLMVLYVLQGVCRELFCVFGDFYVWKTQDAGVTKSLCNNKILVNKVGLYEKLTGFEIKKTF